jgi:hypothetical protein
LEYIAIIIPAADSSKIFEIDYYRRAEIEDPLKQNAWQHQEIDKQKRSRSYRPTDGYVSHDHQMYRDGNLPQFVGSIDVTP